MSKTNFGGSLLPSHDSSTYEILEGEYGKLQVKPINEFEEHVVMFLPNDKEKPRGWTMLAMHPNGYSCKELAKRILDVWNGNRDKYYALSQFDYILDCGGMGRDKSTIEAVINGDY